MKKRVCAAGYFNADTQEVDIVVTTESVKWFELLSDEERSACADELTDTYFAALNAGDWGAFHLASRHWMDLAAQKVLVTA